MSEIPAIILVGNHKTRQYNNRFIYASVVQLIDNNSIQYNGDRDRCLTFFVCQSE